MIDIQTKLFDKYNFKFNSLFSPSTKEKKNQVTMLIISPEVNTFQQCLKPISIRRSGYIKSGFFSELGIITFSNWRCYTPE